MKILGEDINFEIENKKRAVLCFAVMALCIGFTAVNIAGKASKALSPTQPKAQQNAAAQNKANMAQNVVADKSDNLIIESSVISPDALLQKNPFMELKDAEPLEGSTIDEKRKESERAAEAREARKQEKKRKKQGDSIIDEVADDVIVTFDTIKEQRDKKRLKKLNDEEDEHFTDDDIASR